MRKSEEVTCPEGLPCCLKIHEKIRGRNMPRRTAMLSENTWQNQRQKHAYKDCRAVWKYMRTSEAETRPEGSPYCLKIHDKIKGRNMPRRIAILSENTWENQRQKHAYEDWRAVWKYMRTSEAETRLEGPPCCLKIHENIRGRNTPRSTAVLSENTWQNQRQKHAQKDHHTAWKYINAWYYISL